VSESAANLIDVYCQQCGYNLRGLTGDRCPECGHSLQDIRSPASRLPWIKRGARGWIRAYWATVWMAMFRQGRFCMEMVRPVSYADAQWFRFVTGLHIVIPWGAFIWGAYFFVWRHLRGNDFGDAILRSAWSPVVLCLCLVLFVAAATGVPSYFFHPKSLPLAVQNRAVAMSYYACGAMAVSVLPAAVGVVALLVPEKEETWRSGLALFAVCFSLGQFVAWWLDLMHIAARTMRQMRRRVWALGVGTPVVWFELALVIVVGVPFVVLYVLLFVLTLS